MKYLLLLLAATLALGIERNDLVSLVDGYLTGLNVQEDHKKLCQCLDDEVGDTWENIVTTLRQVVWTDQTQAIIAAISFLEPCLFTLDTISFCSAGETSQLLRTLLAAMQDKKAIAQKIRDKLPTLITSLQTFLEQWTKAAYFDAGKIAGTMVDFIFSK